MVKIIFGYSVTVMISNTHRKLKINFSVNLTVLSIGNNLSLMLISFIKDLVLGCLDDADESIRLRALDLLSGKLFMLKLGMDWYDT